MPEQLLAPGSVSECQRLLAPGSVSECQSNISPPTSTPAHLLRITSGCPTFLPHPHREVNSLVRLLQPVMNDTQAFSLLPQTRNFLVLVPESHWFGRPCSGSLLEFPSATYCPCPETSLSSSGSHWFGHLDSCSGLPCSGPLSWVSPLLPALVDHVISPPVCPTCFYHLLSLGHWQLTATTTKRIMKKPTNTTALFPLLCSALPWIPPTLCGRPWYQKVTGLDVPVLDPC